MTTTHHEMQMLATFLRSLLAQAVTPRRLDREHIKCPTCDTQPNVRRILILRCACGRVRFELDFSDAVQFTTSLAARLERNDRERNASEERLGWLRDGR